MSQFPRFLERSFLFLLVLALMVWGQAIRALDWWPPPGGNGYAALQSGGAFPTGASSLYYNPALLAEIEAATGSAFHATYSRQDFPYNMSQNFAGLSLAFPDKNSGWDVGFGFFRNQTSAEYELYAGPGESPETSVFTENVYGLGAAMRLGCPISVGGAVKFYDSDFGSGLTSGGESVDGRATGWAFDIGLFFTSTFHPLASEGLASLDVTPSAGVALQNMGPDAFYVSREQSDPIPLLTRASLGAQARFADALEVSAGVDWERAMDRYSDGEVSDVEGYSVALLGLRYGRAWHHPSGGYREMHQAWAYEFNLLQFHRLRKRISALDFTTAPESFNAGFSTPQGKFLGVPYRLNPGFVVGWRKFDSSWQNENTWYFALSL
jgi:hypothetical protein